MLWGLSWVWTTAFNSIVRVTEPSLTASSATPKKNLKAQRKDEGIFEPQACQVWRASMWETANTGCGFRYVLASHELSAQERVGANFCLLRKSTITAALLSLLIDDGCHRLAQHMALEIRDRLKRARLSRRKGVWNCVFTRWAMTPVLD